MRVSLVTALSVLILIAACKSKTASGNTDPVKTTSQADSTDEKTAKTAALKKLSPLGLEKIEALMPKEIDSAAQKNFSSSMQFGYPFCTADYPKNKTTAIKLTIADCAGDQGTANYATNFWEKLDKNEETADGYSKTVQLMGSKAIESYNKTIDYATLTYMVGDRLMVTLQGKKMKPEELAAVAEKIGLRL
jgi:hypothetical protein